MNRRSILYTLAGMWAVTGLASPTNEAKKIAEATTEASKASKFVYPYNKYTLHRVFSDAHGLPYAGQEDPTIHVLTSVINDVCCDYSGYAFVVIVDGKPSQLLTSKEVIMIPRGDK